jgi:hypothetical protein
VFGVDVLLPVRATEATTAFIGDYPHLKLHLMQWWPSIFHDKRCAYVDVRHASASWPGSGSSMTQLCPKRLPKNLSGRKAAEALRYRPTSN